MGTSLELLANNRCKRNILFYFLVYNFFKKKIQLMSRHLLHLFDLYRCNYLKRRKKIKINEILKEKECDCMFKHISTTLSCHY